MTTQRVWLARYMLLVAAGHCCSSHGRRTGEIASLVLTLILYRLWC